MAVIDIPDWLGTLLFGVRHVKSNGTSVNDSATVNVLPPLAAAYNAGTGEIDLSLADGAATVSTITVSSGGSAEFTIGPVTTTPTFDSSTVVLATIPVPVGGVADVGARVSVILGSGVNANLAPTMYRFTVPAFRIGSGSAVGNGGSTDNAITAPFLDLQSTPTIGAVSARVSGTNVLIEAKGFPAPSAWASGHAYVTGDGSSTVGDFVTSDGSVWVCTTSGTSSGSAPTGTGRAVGTGAKFDRVAPGSTVPVRYTVVITGLLAAA